MANRKPDEEEFWAADLLWFLAIFAVVGLSVFALVTIVHMGGSNG